MSLKQLFQKSLNEFTEFKLESGVFSVYNLTI